jgi:uncharacterized protein
MVTLDRIQDFLAQKRFAFIGVSRQPNDFSRTLFREFLKRGYQPVPVHPGVDEIEGIRCFATIETVDPPVDTALLMTSPDITESLVWACAESGIKRIWFYRATGAGAASPTAVKFCEDHGIAVIPGECPFMFFPGAPLIHRFHGFVKKITRAYPA